MFLYVKVVNANSGRTLIGQVLSVACSDWSRHGDSGGTPVGLEVSPWGVRPVGAGDTGQRRSWAEAEQKQLNSAT